MKKLFISQPMKGKTNEEIEDSCAVEYGIKVIEYVEG